MLRTTRTSASCGAASPMYRRFPVCESELTHHVKHWSRCSGCRPHPCRSEVHTGCASPLGQPKLERPMGLCRVHLLVCVSGVWANLWCWQSCAYRQGRTLFWVLVLRGKGQRQNHCLAGRAEDSRCNPCKGTCGRPDRAHRVFAG
ncbi:hypothetical protein D3C80_1479640 [compost metagenome]